MSSRPPARRFRPRHALLVALALLAGWGFGIEPSRLVVRRETLDVGLPNLKVVAISDLHVGMHVTDGKLRQIVDAANAEEPDLIVLLGDFVRTGWTPRVPPEHIAEQLRPLHARLGVFAVLGNHDWWFNGRRVRRALEGAGIRVLEGEAVDVGPLWLVGVPDEMTRSDYTQLALGQIPATAPTIVLTHNPDVFPEIPARVKLTLAGHTHGGQVRLPLLGAPVVPSEFGQRYLRGHIVEDGRHLFVTTGVGTSILPLRLGVPPEIAVLTLR